MCVIIIIVGLHLLTYLQTWSGNLAQGQGQPTSDLTCIFLAAKGKVEVTDDSGASRMIDVTQDFFPGKNTVNIGKNEIITAGFMPASDKVL